MLRIILAFALIFACVAEDSDVVDLTDDNFHKTIQDNENVLVEFFAPWCGHCKKLAPEWEKAATDLKEDPVVIAKVDATVETAVAQEFGIRGYPTLKYFRNGVAKDYSGARTADAIAAYVRKQLAPAVTYLTTEEEVTAFSQTDKVVVVAFLENADAESSYKPVVDKLRDDFTFGAVIGGDLAAKFGAQTGGYVLFKKFDEGKAVYEEGDLEAWIKANSVPLLDEIGPTNYQSYMDSGLPLLYLFLDPEADNSALTAGLTESARSAKGKVNFCWIDNNKYNSQAGRLGLTGKTVPAIAIDDPKSGFHYAFDEAAEVTVAAAQEWINKFVGGELEPTVKSEDVPEDNSGPVTKLVGKNFDEIVKDSSKDVLVEFYAPWCGHCKKLAPIYERLGEAFADVDSVVIAQIDATANDVDPKYGVRGFPTIKLFPANNKEDPLAYEGERTLEAMATYVKEKGSTEYEFDAEGLKDEL